MRLARIFSVADGRSGFSDKRVDALVALQGCSVLLEVPKFLGLDTRDQCREDATVLVCRRVADRDRSRRP